MSSERIEIYISHLIDNSITLTDVPSVFKLSRDPDDAHYVDLAVAADASYLVTRDLDLLDLSNTPGPEGQQFRDQFPALKIVDPVTLIHLFPQFNV